VVRFIIVANSREQKLETLTNLRFLLPWFFTNVGLLFEVNALTHICFARRIAPIMSQAPSKELLGETMAVGARKEIPISNGNRRIAMGRESALEPVG